MKYAVISDIHSNLEALKSTLEVIDRAGVERIICLGDVVGYGASPNECVEIVRRRCEATIMGNHDAAACDEDYPMGFNPIAREAILWTRQVLKAQNRNFLRSLPAMLDFDEFLVVHGAISDRDRYVFSSYDAIHEFPLMKEHSLCFFGHTHMMVYFELVDDKVGAHVDRQFRLESGAKYMVNPGSVGQPRDRDPRAAHLIFDSDLRIVQFQRVKYDIKAAQDKIIEAGIDSRLAVRLAYGM